MAVGKRHKSKPWITDMIVENHEGVPILLVEVKAREADSRATTQQITKYLEAIDLLTRCSFLVGSPLWTALPSLRGSRGLRRLLVWKSLRGCFGRLN